MSFTMSTGSNGKVRKSLASQLDRLDMILDVLADAIPNAVAHAIESAASQAIRDAVQAALAEALNNPAVLEKFGARLPVAEASQAPRPARVSLSERLATVRNAIRDRLARLRRACAASCSAVRASVGHAWQRVTRRLVLACLPLQTLRQIAWQVVTAVAVGTALAAAAWFAGPGVGAALSGVGGFGSALAMQTGRCLSWLSGRAAAA